MKALTFITCCWSSLVLVSCVCSLLTVASLSVSLSLDLLLQFLCWLLTAEWVSQTCCFVNCFTPGQSLTASRPSLLWLQCCRPLCTVFSTAVHSTVHLYRPVLTRTGPKLSKNWHNKIWSHTPTKTPHTRHETFINWQGTHMKWGLIEVSTSSSPALAVARDWLHSLSAWQTWPEPGLSLGRADFCTVISSAVQAPAQPSPADTGQSFAKYLHSFALFTTQGYILLVLYTICVWNF